MNIGLVGSFVIGGMLLLSIFTMNYNLSQSTSELALSRITKNHVTTVADMVSHDIAKIGYNWMGKIDDPIKTADSTKIVFHSNIDNDTGNTAERVTWTFGNSGVASTSNPNDHVLTRHVTQGGATVTKSDITLGVTNFRIRYYDEVGSTTPMPTPVANPEDIKQIEFDIMVETGEQFYTNSSGGGRYLKSTWHKRFSPINLQD